MLSISVVSSPHDGFDGPVWSYLAPARFRPARVAGPPVRILVRLPVGFRLREG